MTNRKSFLITAEEFNGPRLRAIIEQDLENLRTWKNKNKKSFFYQEAIRKEQQLKWYKNYRKKEDDFMFMAEEATGNTFISFGCMGFRRVANVIDIYNVIRGRILKNSISNMGDAFSLMLSYILEHYKEDITCKVLANNPNIRWYERNCFKIIKKEGDYCLLKLNLRDFRKVPIKRERGV